MVANLQNLIILCQKFFHRVKPMDTVVLLCADVGEELGKGKLSGDHNKAVL